MILDEEMEREGVGVGCRLGRREERSMVRFTIWLRDSR